MKSTNQLLETLDARGLRKELELECRRLGVTLEGALSSSVSTSHARARGLLYVMLKARYGYSAAELGRLFNRDHSSVLSALRTWTPKADQPASPSSPSSRLFEVVQRLRPCACGGSVLIPFLAGNGMEYDSLTLRDLGLEPEPGRTVRITAEYVEGP